MRGPKEIKRRLKKRRVNISETVRTLLEKYMAELELNDLSGRLDALKEKLAGRIDGKLVACQHVNKLTFLLTASLEWSHSPIASFGSG